MSDVIARGLVTVLAMALSLWALFYPLMWVVDCFDKWYVENIKEREPWEFEP